VIGYIVRRLLALIPLLLIISFIVFSLSLLIPGDPARYLAGGNNATAAQVLHVRHVLNLDKSFLQQYWIWLSHAARGDLGTSLYDNQTVAASIQQKFPVTFWIAIGGLTVAILLGIPAGLAAGTHPGSALDRVVTFGTSLGVAIPDFWLGTIVISIFAIKFHWTYAGFIPIEQDPVGWFKSLILLWIVIGVAGAAGLARQLRGAVIDVMQQDYIRTARAKGLPSRRVILKHTLKNAGIAPITVLGLTFAYLLGGTAILENIFNKNGLGQYFLQSLYKKDLPVIQGVTLVVAVTFVVINLFIDVLYAYLNPKVRLG
jgi:peptide/nickel transport system permease protein